MDERLQQEQEFRNLAKSLNLTPKQLRQHLTALGWQTLKSAAGTNAGEMALGGDTPQPDAVLTMTAKAMLPQLASLPTDGSEPAAPGPGYIYVLYDGVTKQSKIGCTRNDGQRQRAIMGAHSHVLANVLTARVNDMFAAEKQCHQYFAATRKGGEWFAADLEDIVAYIGREVDWEALSMENMARMAQYLVACRLGDMEMARFALTGPNFPVKET